MSRETYEINGLRFTGQSLARALCDLMANCLWDSRQKDIFLFEYAEGEAKAASEKERDRDFAKIGACIYGLGMGAASPLPPDGVIGVGLISCADQLFEQFAREYNSPEESDLAQMARRGIFSAWEARGRR